MSKSISVLQAAELQKNGATLVDVRELAEFLEVSAPGAINIPLSLIQKIGNDAYRNQGIDPNTEGLLVICRSGGRSGMACGQLGDNAINVEGGMLAWQAAGLPVN
ncbi:MAG: rhodanese-like domain-containing protein [Arenimonas sp.]|nr:rhodanese-like domain-containing protein [Arenimonas sp.]